ncbi:MAG: DUF2971 domain-containing protein [Fibromonadaceae bacterium]|jgi:tetratricopeptide (TPR) repeat protein|nr:DUF2971 domain-containing protein [Fibromonadaceae bacterium]
MKNESVEYWTNEWEIKKSKNLEEGIKFFTENARLYQRCVASLNKIEQDKSEFENILKKYEKDALSKPDCSNTFYNLGNVLYILAEIKKDESLFWKAFEKYAKAANLDLNNNLIFEHWANALASLAQLKESGSLSKEFSKNVEQGELLFEKTFEEYGEIKKLKSKHAKIFFNWGDVLASLARVKQDKDKFKKAIEKYEKAADLDPGYYLAFNNWGSALADLARVEQDESKFNEAFEKYQRAEDLDESDAVIFYNFGRALTDLARIKLSKLKRLEELNKSNESLFKETLEKCEESFEKAFEKCKKAVELKEDYTVALNTLGNAHASFAQLKKSESLFEKAFKEYETAVQTAPEQKKKSKNDEKYAYVYNNWGNALVELAELNKENNEKEALERYNEAFEKYEKAVTLKQDYTVAFNNWGAALAKFAKIKREKNLEGPFKKFYEKSDELKKLKKSILEILVLFKVDIINVKEVLGKKFYVVFDPLLKCEETIDGKFFQETTKNLAKEDLENLDEYKKAYISSILIISKLYINFEKEKLIAHYTKKAISQEILIEKEHSKFQLSVVNYGNDPTEGETLLNYLFGKKCPEREGLNIEYGAFAGCFTFDYDSLNQFRLYGKEEEKEGTGLSLVFNESFFSKEAKMPLEQIQVYRGEFDETYLGTTLSPIQKSEKHALFRCIYIDPIAQRVETVGHKESYVFFREKEAVTKDEVEQYRIYIAEITDFVDEKMRKLKERVRDLNSVIVGRLLINLRYLTKHVAFKEEQECRIIKIHHLKDEEVIIRGKRVYVEYEPKIHEHLEEIYFGPEATEIEWFQDVLVKQNQNREKEIFCKKSKNPLASKTSGSG